MSDTNIKEIFGNRLKKARIEKGITQAELSKLTTLTASTISAYEKCQKVPNLSSASELSKALGVSIDWLCGAESQGMVDWFNDLSPTQILTELTYVCSLLGSEAVEVSNNNFDCYAKLVFKQPKVVDFISGFKKLMELHESKILSDDLFNAGKHGLIDQYKTLDFMDYGLPF